MIYAGYLLCLSINSASNGEEFGAYFTGGCGLLVSFSCGKFSEFLRTMPDFDLGIGMLKKEKDIDQLGENINGLEETLLNLDKGK